MEKNIVKRYKMAVLAVSMGCSLALSGCQPEGKGKIAIGKVDTAVLLQDDPDYQSLSVDYLREQTDMKKKFVDKMKAAGDDEGKIKTLQQEYVKASEEFNGTWQQKTQNFLKTRHDSIQATAGNIAKQKKIDIVIIDSEMYPTVEWGGVDMTKDMALAMSDGSQATPQPSGTPQGDKG